MQLLNVARRRPRPRPVSQKRKSLRRTGSEPAAETWLRRSDDHAACTRASVRRLSCGPEEIAPFGRMAKCPPHPACGEAASHPLPRGERGFSAASLRSSSRDLPGSDQLAGLWILRVFQLDTHAGERVANAICFLEVLCLARGMPLRNERIDISHA